MVIEKPTQPFVVTTVPFSVGMGRIIVIVLQEPDDFDGINSLDLQPYVDAARLVPHDTEDIPKVLPNEKWLTDIARMDADNLLNDELSELPQDTFLVLNQGGAESVAKKKGADRVAGLGQRGQYDDPRKLNAAYVHAFVGSLTEAEHGKYASRFLSQEDWCIQQIVDKDKQEARLERSRKYHQRDLAVIRAQEKIPVSLSESIDRLDEIHAWADKYEAACRETRKGLVWPTRETFRTN